MEFRKAFDGTGDGLVAQFAKVGHEVNLKLGTSLEEVNLLAENDELALRDQESQLILTLLAKLVELDTCQDGSHAWCNGFSCDTRGEEMRLFWVGSECWIVVLEFGEIRKENLVEVGEIGRELSSFRAQRFRVERDVYII